MRTCTRRLHLAGLLLVCLAFALAGCGSKNTPSTLSPHSPQAHRITNLWWVMLGAASVGFGLIVVLLFVGWWRRNRPQLPGGGNDRKTTAWLIGLGIALPIVLLSALFVWSDILVVGSTAAPPPSTTGLTVRVIGHQWFWEVRYPGTRVVTANEIHIPVRTRVLVIATTDDVIHSFWVPALNRKIDMIPGRRNTELLYADTTGVYPGRCAEFCGLQHAHMSLLVYADPPDRFRAWLAGQAKPAHPAAADVRLFQSGGCDDCHTIRGTGAAGRVGPDLTHLASRHTLAADTLANTPAELKAWIADPQHSKPGNRMPAPDVTPAQLDKLVTYLGTLR